jgi:predicted nucleic acid-binding protein
VISSYDAWLVEPTTPDPVTRAIDISAMAQIMFWDALIVASAEQAQATQICSEDLNAGQTIAGMRIVNPFASA